MLRSETPYEIFGADAPTEWRCDGCQKPLTAAQVHRRGSQEWTVEWHFCNDCNPVAERGTGVTKEWDRPLEELLRPNPEHDAAHAAYMAQFDGRGYLGATRCRLCGEFGVFADSQACPDCDQALQEAKRGQREADMAFLLRWARHYGTRDCDVSELATARCVMLLRDGEEPPVGSNGE